MLEIRYYVAASGEEPFAQWFARLDATAAARIARALARMEQGNLSNVKSVGEGVLEYRVDFGPGYRIYFGRSGRRHHRYPVDRRYEEAAAARHRRSASKLARLQAEQAWVGSDWWRLRVAKAKNFRDLVHSRVKTDKKFAEALLREGIDAMLSGDVDTGKTILRDYIKATVGFEQLGEATGAPAKSLIRMFGPRGNPQAKNLFSVIGYLQKRAGLSLHVVG